MATLISAIETKVRLRLEEPVAKFWSSDELVGIIADGIRDLWRDVVDLRREHFITISTSVTLPANTATMASVPTDVHKIIMITPLDISPDSANRGLAIRPTEFNSDYFQSALSRDAIEPSNDTIYYAVTGQGAPVGAPTLRVAPQSNTLVALSFAYVPTLGALTSASSVPIPGEADNALIAWAVSYARAKEREDRAPDPNWLSIYATEKAHLLKSLETRQTQEHEFASAMFEGYW